MLCEVEKFIMNYYQSVLERFNHDVVDRVFPGMLLLTIAIKSIFFNEMVKSSQKGLEADGGQKNTDNKKQTPKERSEKLKKKAAEVAQDSSVDGETLNTKKVVSESEEETDNKRGKK